MTGNSRKISSVMTIAPQTTTILDQIRVYAEKLVFAPKSHKIEYVPMHTIREITRLATMLAGLITPWLGLGFVSATRRLRIGYTSTTTHLHLDYALAQISCEHCRSSRNSPHCAPRHVILYSSFLSVDLRTMT